MSAAEAAVDPLLTLLRAIASRDRSATSRLLRASPALAQLAVKVGATRGDAGGYYFEEIRRHVYTGDTPLHVAAATYQRHIAEELVSGGAHVRARNRRGAEPLHYAADGSPGSTGWSPDAQSAVVEFLIAAGADPNAMDQSGVAPLHRAVRTRSTPAVSALLAHGADVRRKNASGSTPLHLAVQNTGRGGTGAEAARAEQSAIIQLLLSHGARSSDTNAAGKTARECVKAEWILAALS